MKNKCVYTKEVMKEFHYASLMYYAKKFIAIMLIAFALAFINFISKLATYNISAYTILLVVIPVAFLLAIVENEKKAFKVELERMSVIYGKTEVETIVELYDVIKMTTENKNEREISYDHVLAYKETKNLLVIILDGRMIIPLSKDGFIEGDLESCREFLKSEIKV